MYGVTERNTELLSRTCLVSILLGRFLFAQNFRLESPETFRVKRSLAICSKLAIALEDKENLRNGEMLGQEDNKMEILYNRTVNFHSDRLEKKKWRTSEGRSLVPGIFPLIREFHLHFKQLNRKFWLNGKRPGCWLPLFQV